MIEPGTFQQNMDTMFEENGLQKVTFPKQTNIQGMKELYQDIPKSSDEAFGIEMEEEMEMEMTYKRQRDSSVSPQLMMDSKNNIKQGCHQSNQDFEIATTGEAPCSTAGDAETTKKSV